MNCNPTLTSEEFTGVHNALCRLRGLQGRMNSWPNERTIAETADSLNKIIGEFEESLKGAYRQDNDAWSRKNRHYTDQGTQQGFKSTWSIYEVDDLSQPHNLGESVELAYVRHWGKRPVVAEIEGNTWLDLWRAADAAIRKSGDMHHIFIEGFELNKYGQLELTTGS
jgi:hypothetical protein